MGKPGKKDTKTKMSKKVPNKEQQLKVNPANGCRQKLLTKSLSLTQMATCVALNPAEISKALAINFLRNLANMRVLLKNLLQKQRQGNLPPKENPSHKEYPKPSQQTINIQLLPGPKPETKPPSSAIPQNEQNQEPKPESQKEKTPPIRRKLILPDYWEIRKSQVFTERGKKMYPIPPPMESEQPKTAREVQPKVAEEATRDRHHITEPTNIFEEVGKQANPNLENLAKLENMAFMTSSSKKETTKEENNHPTTTVSLIQSLHQLQ